MKTKKNLKTTLPREIFNVYFIIKFKCSSSYGFNRIAFKACTCTKFKIHGCHSLETLFIFEIKFSFKYL